MKIPKTQYLLVDEKGNDISDSFHQSLAEAELMAKDFLENDGDVVFICEIVPKFLVTLRNQFQKEALT